MVDRDGLLRAVLQGHTARVISAEFSPDGSRIVTGSLDQTTKVWHPDGTLLATLEGQPVDFSAVDFNADGSRIFGADGSRITTTGTDDEPEQRVWSVFSLSEAVAELERRLGGRQLSEDECLVHSIDPCPVS